MFRRFSFEKILQNAKEILQKTNLHRNRLGWMCLVYFDFIVIERLQFTFAMPIYAYLEEKEKEINFYWAYSFVVNQNENQNFDQDLNEFDRDKNKFKDFKENFPMSTVTWNSQCEC